MILAAAMAAGAQVNPAKVDTSNPDQSPSALVREPPQPDSCKNQTGKPINMLVFGDSIMWGQGLKEENKISYRVQNWLCRRTQRPVKLWREAHSGAIIGDGAEDDKDRDGEINVGKPTIWAELNHALSTHFKDRAADVDFVLMDGCINDFDVVKNLLDATITPGQVQTLSRKMCYDRMKPLLEKAASDLPNARFIVTGYYPVMTEKSSRNLLLRALLGWILRIHFAKEKEKWLFPSAKRTLFKTLVQASKEFGESSNADLRESVAKANGTSNRIVFAPVYYKPNSGFGSPGSGFAAPKNTSLLWTSMFNSTGHGGLTKFFYVVFKLNFHALRPNDEVYKERKASCKQEQDFSGFSRLTCQVAAFGHPNEAGVNEYVERVIMELQRILDTTDWLKK